MQSQTIYPELGQTTQAEIQFKVGYSNKYYISTKLVLKGRGITQLGDGSTNKLGNKTYYATQKAMDKLKKEYSTCYIGNL